jgi:hypothetical protein
VFVKLEPEETDIASIRREWPRLAALFRAGDLTTVWTSDVKICPISYVLSHRAADTAGTSNAAATLVDALSKPRETTI